MFASATLATPFNLSRRQPHERRVAFALVWSSAFHVVAGIAAAAFVALHPASPPEPLSDAALLQATLQTPEPSPAPPQLEIAPLPERVADLVPMLAPPPTLPLPAAMAPPRPAQPVARPPINATDPNGSVTMGLLEDPNVLGRAVATRLAERYATRPDKLPRMVGSLIVPYPPDARQARASARISAVLDIDERGRITHATLVPDHRWFGPAVTEVLKEARFTPAELATNPVPYWAVVEFVFAIAPGPGSMSRTAAADPGIQPINGM